MRVPATRRVASGLADVRPGERQSTLLFGLNLFLLLGAYYLLKTVREALILGEKSAEVKSYASAGQAILLLLLVPLYGRLATRVNRLRLLNTVTLIFIVNLLLFYLAGAAGTHIAVAFYLWVGIFNVGMVSQIWAFANDLHTEEQGKRLFPLIAIGSSLGAWGGARWAAGLVKELGPYPLLLISAGVLLLCMAINHAIQASSLRPGRDGRRAAEPLGATGGFQLILQDRYLLLIAGLVVLLNVVNSSGEFLLGKLVAEQAHQVAATELGREKFVGAFYAGYFGWVNLISLLVQAFAVARVFRLAGVGGALFVLPVIALGGYSLMLAWPALHIIRAVKILENSTDYSLQNTTRQALWLPTSREAKYKAKAAVDTFFMRAGDVLQAAIVYVGTSLGFGIQQFAAVSIVLTLAWLGIAWTIRRENNRRVDVHRAELRELQAAT